MEGCFLFVFFLLFFCCLLSFFIFVFLYLFFKKIFVGRFFSLDQEAQVVMGEPCKMSRLNANNQSEFTVIPSHKCFKYTPKNVNTKNEGKGTGTIRTTHTTSSEINKESETIRTSTTTHINKKSNTIRTSTTTHINKKSNTIRNSTTTNPSRNYPLISKCLHN